jgi:hypothetical protein
LLLLRYSRLRCHQSSLHGASRRLSRSVSTDAKANGKRETDASGNAMEDGEAAKTKEPKKMIAQLDEELRMKLEGRSGDGGAAGLELENGQPVAMYVIPFVHRMYRWCQEVTSTSC